MTKAERKARAIDKQLARCLIAIEFYEGDPEDVLNEADLEINNFSNAGAEGGLKALREHYVVEHYLAARWRAKGAVGMTTAEIWMLEEPERMAAFIDRYLELDEMTGNRTLPEKMEMLEICYGNNADLD